MFPEKSQHSSLDHFLIPYIEEKFEDGDFVF